MWLALDEVGLKFIFVLNQATHFDFYTASCHAWHSNEWQTPLHARVHWKPRCCCVSRTFLFSEGDGLIINSQHHEWSRNEWIWSRRLYCVSFVTPPSYDIVLNQNHNNVQGYRRHTQYTLQVDEHILVISHLGFYHAPCVPSRRQGSRRHWEDNREYFISDGTELLLTWLTQAMGVRCIEVDPDIPIGGKPPRFDTQCVKRAMQSVLKTLGANN